MGKVILGVLFATLLSGCSSIKMLDIFSQPVKKTPLNLIEPEPLTVKAPKWIIVTPENAQEIWKKLSKDNENVVLFALTDSGYEQLSLTMAEIRSLINSQRLIIKEYKRYYETEEK